MSLGHSAVGSTPLSATPEESPAPSGVPGQSSDQPIPGTTFPQREVSSTVSAEIEIAADSGSPQTFADTVGRAEARFTAQAGGVAVISEERRREVLSRLDRYAEALEVLEPLFTFLTEARASGAPHGAIGHNSGLSDAPPIPDTTDFRLAKDAVEYLRIDLQSETPQLPTVALSTRIIAWFASKAGVVLKYLAGKFDKTIEEFFKSLGRPEGLASLAIGVDALMRGPDSFIQRAAELFQKVGQLFPSIPPM